MQAYIGAKVIAAEPMDSAEFGFKYRVQRGYQDQEENAGYRVQYSNPGGSVYDSWSPKDVFERAYRLVSEDEAKLIK